MRSISKSVQPWQRSPPLSHLFQLSHSSGQSLPCQLGNLSKISPACIVALQSTNLCPEAGHPVTIKNHLLWKAWSRAIARGGQVEQEATRGGDRLQESHLPQIFYWSGTNKIPNQNLLCLFFSSKGSQPARKLFSLKIHLWICLQRGERGVKSPILTNDSWNNHPLNQTYVFAISSNLGTSLAELWNTWVTKFHRLSLRTIFLLRASV